MAETFPASVEEWQQYISGLTGDVLWAKATACNHIGFVRMLEDEGYSPDEIEAVFLAFAKQFQADGQEPPSGEGGDYFDFMDLLYPQPLVS
jgi:hypothetical protein